MRFTSATKQRNQDYGNTLLNFTEKVSLLPFPFSAGISGSGKQIKRRILNIVSYEKPSVLKKARQLLAFILTTALLAGLAPLLTTASDDTQYRMQTPKESLISWNHTSYPIDAWNRDHTLSTALKNSVNWYFQSIDQQLGKTRISSHLQALGYGKTGTGRVNHQDVNGWFVGIVDCPDRTYAFATNIQGTQNATGSLATEISLAILSRMGVWTSEQHP